MVDRRYAELVLHVLGHVGLPEPGSLYEPEYVTWCAERLGQVQGRELGEDARLLSELLAPLDLRLRVQLLALLFEGDSDAARAGLVDLDAFEDQGVRGYDPAVWRQLLPSRTQVEVLRVACEVERVHLARISPPNPEPALDRYLVEITEVAPMLARLPVRQLRPLWRRGRLMQQEIWVGVAKEGEGPGFEHVAWQAAHEATLRELSLLWRSTEGYDFELECASLALIGERARRSRHGEAQLRWWGALGGDLPRGIAELSGRVPERLERIVTQLCGA